MVNGKIETWEIRTLESDLSEMTPDDKGCESYLEQMHKTAEANGRYVVRIGVSDGQKVSVFLPKGLVDNGLVEKGAYLECGSSSCHLSINGVIDWFDRAVAGATQIHDKRFKGQSNTEEDGNV